MMKNRIICEACVFLFPYRLFLYKEKECRRKNTKRMMKNNMQKEKL